MSYSQLIFLKDLIFVWMKTLPGNAAGWFIFSDESYFYLTKTANKQNNRLWLETWPKSGFERPLYDQKVLVWWAMSSRKIYGPYFFESTVNQNNFHNMLVRFFWSKVVREDYKKYYFKQDGASPHTSKKAQNYLRSNLSNPNLERNLLTRKSGRLDLQTWIHVTTFNGIIINQEYIIHCQEIWMILKPT